MPPRAILALMEADRRRLLRDGLMVWMMILPLVMAAAARAGLPELVLVLEGRGIMIGPWVPQLRAVAFTVVVPVLIGVVVGFMLLEEKQDRVWRALAVTGVRLRRYLVWRAMTCLAVAAPVCLLCLVIAGPPGLSAVRQTCLALGAAPLAAAVALGLAAWTRDAIQGFAATKLLLVLLVLPAVAPLLGAPWRELLVLVPSWWIVRAAEIAGAMNDGGRWFPLVLGSAAVNLLIAGAAVALVAAARRRPTLAGRALGAVVGANITTQILKDYILNRPNLGVTTGAGNSLPSGHTTVAVTISLALVVVAPKLSRSPSAWLGWAWTALMGVSVMMEGWHRPADVITAVLIAGAWALALSPIERRPRHGAHVQRIMVWISLGLLALALVATVAGLWGFSMSAASPGSGYGFEDFLQIRPWRSLVLGVAAVAWVSAVCGLVMHEVDRLAGQ